MRTLFLTPILALAALPSLSQALDYSNDFSGPVGSEWSYTNTMTSPNGSQTFLGELGAQTATLTLTGLTPNVPVSLSFDLYIIRSWDGNAGNFGGGAGDTWSLTANGTALVSTTFNNFSGAQSYDPSNPIGPGNFATGNGANSHDTLGYSFGGQYQDSTYRFNGGTNPSFTFTPTVSTLSLSFTGGTNEDLGNESWGLDNVRVTQAGVQATPEPFTMGLLAAGLGLAARRRKAPARTSVS